MLHSPIASKCYVYVASLGNSLPMQWLIWGGNVNHLSTTTCMVPGPKGLQFWWPWFPHLCYNDIMSCDCPPSLWMKPKLMVIPVQITRSSKPRGMLIVMHFWLLYRMCHNVKDAACMQRWRCNLLTSKQLWYLLHKIITYNLHRTNNCRPKHKGLVYILCMLFVVGRCPEIFIYNIILLFHALGKEVCWQMLATCNCNVN